MTKKVAFSGGGHDGAPPPPPEQPPIPPLMDVLVGGKKVCPIMGATILVMPIVQPGSTLLAPQQQQGAFVRQFSPCVEASCALWNEEAKCCSFVLGSE